MLFILILCILLFLNIYLFYLIFCSNRAKNIYKAKNKILEINSKYIDIKNKGILDESPLLKDNLSSYIQDINGQLIIGNKVNKKSNNDDNNIEEELNELNNLEKKERKIIVDLMIDISCVSIIIIKTKSPIIYIRHFLVKDIVLKFLLSYNYILEKLNIILNKDKKIASIKYKSKFINNMGRLKGTTIYNSMINTISYNNFIK